MESIQSQPHHFQWMRLPLDLVNELPQPRKTFEDVEELGDDVADKGMYYTPVMVAYDTEHCQQHLNLINELWHTNFQVKDLVYRMEKDVKVFYVLLDGGRRYRSCKYLRDVGCQKCREEYGPGGCYKRHFSDLSVDIRFYFNLNPDDAIDIQASANTYKRVPPVEEAGFYDRLFKSRKTRNPKYTLKEFAYKMGRKPEVIRQAMRFCELPLEYQEYVERGYIPWGMMQEIARLHVQGLTEKELDWWVNRAITGKYRIPEFRKLVSEFLYNQNHNQISLFTQAQEKEMRKSGFRQVVERHYVMGFWNFIQYFNQVQWLFETGKLGLKDSPFAEGSPIKLYRQLIDVAERNLPHFRKLRRFPREEADRAQLVFDESNKLLSRLEKKVPEKDKVTR